MSSHQPSGPPSAAQSSNNINPPLTPTYEHGIIYTTMDAFIILRNCLEGRLNHVSRRPSDKERENTIVSGNIFCYEENASGIKRWTDGVTWSPSRILFNCLVYRELAQSFPPGEKKKALKKNRKNGTGAGISRPGNSQISRPGIAQTYGAAAAAAQSIGSLNGTQNAADNANDPRRMFLGSLLDSYPFKEDGLVKKTISFNVNGVTHHIVSYYTLDDAQSGRLSQPSLDQRLLQGVDYGLLNQQNFRMPLEQECPLSVEANFEPPHFQHHQQPHGMMIMNPDRNYVALPPHMQHVHPYPPPGHPIPGHPIPGHPIPGHPIPQQYYGEDQRQQQYLNGEDQRQQQYLNPQVHPQQQQQHDIYPLNDPSSYNHNLYYNPG